MNRLFFCLAFIAVIVSCSTDLTDIENRIAELEAQKIALINESNNLQQQVNSSKEKYEQLMATSQDLVSKRKALESLLDSLQHLSTKLDSLINAQNQLIMEQGSLLAEQNGINAQLEAEILSLKEQQIIIQNMIDSTQAELDVLANTMIGVEPKLYFFDFLASDNPMELVEDARCEIIGDSVLECRVLNVMTSKSLIPRFGYDGEKVTIDDGTTLVSGVTTCDFSRERTITVSTETQSRKYYVVVYSYTGLPTLWLETKNLAKIVTAGQVYKGSIRLLGSIVTDNGLSDITSSADIMGVDPIRWYTPTISQSEQPGKTNYEIDLESAKQLFGEATATDWCLQNNYYDRSMLHNKTAFYMGTISKLDYTPHYHYVDVILNGRYHGVYMLGDQLEAAEDRVNVGKTGYIISVNEEANTKVFYTSRISTPFSILYPTSMTTSAEKYIASFVKEAETILYSNNFLDKEGGWQSYLDMDSFVDWYLINEIAKNNNGAFKNHCVMHMERGGKLKMGPLWDFERAFNNNSQSVKTDGFVIKNAGWFARLFQDPAFVAKVKERFDYFYSHQNDILNNINENAQLLKYAIAEDDHKWSTFNDYESSEYDTWVLYQGMVRTMKNWLMDRMDWLKSQFEAM